MPVRQRGDELPVRTPVDFVATAAPITPNETNYDTLAILRKYVDERIEAQYKDFNAFDIAKNEGTLPLQRQLDRKQAAYDELIIIREALDSAVQGVDLKYKEK